MRFLQTHSNTCHVFFSFRSLSASVSALFFKSAPRPRYQSPPTCLSRQFYPRPSFSPTPWSSWRRDWCTWWRNSVRLKSCVETRLTSVDQPGQRRFLCVWSYQRASDWDLEGPVSESSVMQDFRKIKSTLTNQNNRARLSTKSPILCSYFLIKVFGSIYGILISHFRVAFLPLFQSESWCIIFPRKISLVWKTVNDVEVKVISIWKVVYQDSFWNRGERHIENGLFS